MGSTFVHPSPLAERARILDTYAEPDVEAGEPSTDAAETRSTGAPTVTPATATAPTFATPPASRTALASATATATATPSGSTASTSAPAAMPPPLEPHRPSASSQPSTSQATRQTTIMGSLREGQHRKATRTIAQMFFDLNLHFIMATSRILREAVSKIAVYGPSYTPPQPTCFAALCSRDGLPRSERD
ncbi:hypothetical protein O6H91_01G003300 [Diphasiastrum complanatum]|uniref:Uncharacterized protein n=1 Tax=Diphasiastrum complanatum TaxID=34168 RepID=A0ACC2EMP2_DIPCM|nr:hypothetical protein O6H91_01G003300 [Diphasiastrum complanatum]